MRTHRTIELALIAVACMALGGCRVAGLMDRGVAEPGRVTSLPDASNHEETTPEQRAERERIAVGERAALAPLEPYWPYRLAQMFVEIDSLSAAEASLRASLEREPSYAPALALLSKLYFGSRRHAEGIALLEAARKQGAVPDELLAGLAMHYDALDQPEQARAILATLADPGRASIRPARVFVMLRGETPDDAVKDAVKAVGDEPKSAVHQNNFGITKLRAGDVRAARAAFMAAIEIDSKLPGPYYNLAILEKFYGLDDRAAKRWFDAYWKRSHDDPDSLQPTFGALPAAESDDLAKQGGAR